MFFSTVEVGVPRLVQRFGGNEDPNSFPVVALPSLRSCHCLHSWGSSALHLPSSLREGNGEVEDTGLSLEGKDLEVTYLTSTHSPLARIQSHSHILLWIGWITTSWVSRWPDKSPLTEEGGSGYWSRRAPTVSATMRCGMENGSFQLKHVALRA